MEFLSSRLAIVAAIRSINRGSTVGMMIGTSNGPWQKNGIILIDSDGNFFPAEWIIITEMFLDDGAEISLEMTQTLVQMIPHNVKNELKKCINTSRITKDFNAPICNDDQLCQRQKFKYDKMPIGSHFRRNNAVLLIGYDTRPRNSFYALIIRSICNCFNIKTECFGYTTLPILSCMVRTRNKMIHERISVEVKCSCEYLKSLAETYNELLSLRIKHFDNISKCTLNMINRYPEKPRERFEILKGAYLDLANGVVAIFVHRLFDGYLKPYIIVNMCRTFNSKSVVLYYNQIAQNARTVRANMSNSELSMSMNPSNHNSVIKAIVLLTFKSGVDYVLRTKTSSLIKYAVTQNEDDDLNHFCTFDSDGDRLVFYLKNIDSLSVTIIKGGQIAALFAYFFKTILARIDCIEYSMVVALNTYTNSAIKLYIQRELNISVVDHTNSILDMRHVAEQADIGIYFTVNGHGSVLFSKSFNDKLLTLINFLNERIGLKTNVKHDFSKCPELFKFYWEYTNERLVEHLDLCMIIFYLTKLINQVMGDALANFLAIEFILSYEKMKLPNWNFLCREISCHEINWNPSKDFNNLPLDSETCGKITHLLEYSGSNNGNRYSILQHKIVNLLIEAGAYQYPYLREESLSYEERKVMGQMETLYDFEFELKKLNVMLDLEEIFKSWAPKFKCWLPGRLISSIIILINAVQVGKSRIDVCLDESKLNAKIYVESCLPDRTVLIAIGIMLLLRIHTVTS
ncbi:hypothetical protein GJ496_003986 [Pomphorhynchus laevis]|nr:hypothetical protein GJ496_003986 [Pomphorhynchus laevis]